MPKEFAAGMARLPKPLPKWVDGELPKLIMATPEKDSVGCYGDNSPAEDYEEDPEEFGF